MTVESIVYALLSGAGPVTSIVGARIYPTVLPQGEQTPAIVIEQISSVQQSRMDAQASAHLYRARVQINLLGALHPQLVSLRTAVINAVQFARGSIAGAVVHAVLPDVEGSITFSEELGLYHRPLDFIVLFSA